MKKFYNVLMVLIISGLIASCATTGGTSSTAPRGVDYSRYSSLADILRTMGGITVMGVGSNVQVLIRGISTIKLDTQPLYVIDNVPIGTDYNMANNAVQPVNIRSVIVLKDKSQTTRWGELGTNGVILIKTKTSPDK